MYRVLILLFLLFSFPAYAEEYLLPNAMEFLRAQETPATCWAASNRMLLASQGIDVTEESQLQKVFGSKAVRSAGPDFSNAQRGIDGIFTATDGSRYRVRPYVSYRYQNRPADGQWIVDSLRDGRPIVTTDRIHGYVIYGASWNVINGATYITRIYVIDPLHDIDPINHPALQWYDRIHPLYQNLIGFMGFNIEPQ